MKQHELLLKCFKMIKDSGVCPENSITDWVKSLLYLHTKGWLYTGFENEEPVMVAAMYRIQEFNKDKINTYPDKEEGKILYIPFFTSIAKDKNMANRLFKQYLKQQDIDEIIFYERNSDDKLKRFKRRKENVQEKNTNS